MRRSAISSRSRAPIDPGISLQPAAQGHAQGAPLPLLVWLSPQFPVGSFAYSHGMEWAVEAGRVSSAATASAWIESLLTHGALRNDLVLASLAHRAAGEERFSDLNEVAALALALAGSRERYLETSAQGNAFLTAIRTAWLTPELERILDGIEPGDCAYPIAVALSSAGWRFARTATLEAYAMAWVQTLVSAVIRLSVIGQSDGQRLIAALLPVAAKAAADTADATLQDLGAAAFQSDIAAIRHENQRTRLFRS